MANPNVILQWNCDGLRGKRSELDLMIAQYSPAVICLQEVKLPLDYERLIKDKKPLPFSVVFNGYTPYFKCIETGANGIAIYVKKHSFPYPS